MGKLKYLVIHTSDTPYNREITPDDIASWHLGAEKQSNGLYKFLGKTYNKNQLEKMTLTLPSGKKIQASLTNGRGWSKTGYADLIQRSGKIVNMNPYDFNDTIDPWEVTNGVAGINSISRHVCLAGGWSKDGKYKCGIDVNKKWFKISDLYTPEQIESLIDYINMQLQQQPDLIICGHNQHAAKSCPNFRIPDFIKEYADRFPKNIKYLTK